MELTTFGALMRFAMELERAAADFYAAAAQNMASQPLKDTFTSLGKEGRRRAGMLERARQEKVTEMILEPIHSLNQADYALSQIDVSNVPPENLLRHAVQMETTAARFYADALKAGRRLLGEVSRTFERLAQEKASHRARLEGLSSSLKGPQ